MNQLEVFGKALWLSDGSEDSSKFLILRGKFNVKNAKKATLNVLGLGFFHCYINGTEVTDDLFLPLTSDHEPRKNFPTGEVLSHHRTYVSEFDVTHLLRDGENVLAIHFGGGWYTYNHPIENFKDSEMRFGKPKAIWRITGEDESGLFDFASGEDNKLLPGFAKDYYMPEKETLDYTVISEDALSPDFDDTSYPFATSVTPPDTDYLFSDCPHDKVGEVLSVKKIKQTDEYTLYDCGKNISGYPVLSITAEKGEAVKCIFSEELTNGELDQSFSHRQEFTVISDGVMRTVRPLFTWFGFRYFALYGKAEALSVEFIHSDVAVTGEFKSDNEILNFINDAFITTQLSNMHGGIPSDCPHLERRGYTGDGQLICHSAMSVLSAKDFYRKWIYDIFDCQDTLTGHVQYTAPYTHSGGGPGGWGCAIIEVPYQYYLHYGETDVLTACYPKAKRYFDYLESHSENDLIVRDKEGEWCLGDWCPPTSVVLPAPFVNNYFYIKSLNRAIEIAKLTGNDADIPLFEERINKRKKAIMSAYFNAWDGNFLGGVQGANAFALDIGLGDWRTFPNLVSRYEKMNEFDTGIFGTDLVIKLLFRRGKGDVAVKLLTSKGIHSFYEMMHRGATTLFEYWPESLRDRSHNHPMFGAVTAYLYDYLLGLRQKDGSSGFDDLIIAPVLVDEINHLSGKRVLPKGEVSVSYEKKDEKVYFTITIPEGQNAEFILGETKISLSSRENKLTLDL